MQTYLERLTIRLATGVASLPEDEIERRAEYFLRAQREDGGFAGREGESDLYYTGFALRSLAILGALYGDPAEKAAGYLQRRLTGRETIVDFLSLIYGAALVESAAGIDIFADAAPTWRDAVADTLEELRRDDGGYSKSSVGMASSTYHTFLVLLCRELIERPMPEPDRAVAFIMSQRSDEGGFREIRASKRAGTNPTAAAVGVLRTLGSLDDDTANDTIDFLLDMQTSDGGLRANTRIPIADLLSTFTGVLTLTDLGAADELDRPAALKFAHSLSLGNGGFRGAELDPEHDIEYSFYGVGALALLTPTAA